VRELAQYHPDDQIADILNAEGVTNALEQEWNLGRVRSVRYKNQIETACPYVTSKPGPRGDGLIPSREAAEALGVSPFQIAEWFRFGWLVGHQRQVGSPLWIRVTEDDRRRWTGEVPLAPDMVPVGNASAVLRMSQAQMAAEVHAGRLLTYRIRIKKGWRWYVRVPAEQAIP
jgi:hypothetical protein